MVKPPGQLLASGRDADIFEYGPGFVLRRSRKGRSIEYEARVMTYLRDQGYPVPAVTEMNDDGTELVMERIEGVSMVEAIGKAPWSVRRQAKTLANLHKRLHEIAAPDFFQPAPVGRGDRVVHLDLHPLNVMIGPKGATVIDWTNAGAGDPQVDVGLAWVLIAAGEVPGRGMLATVLGWGRALLVNGFVDQFDRREVGRHLRAVVEYKEKDQNMSAAEIARMWKIVERVESRS
jgi:aminoglycoside phosphotransferase (APT) family kinase protein